MGVRIFRIVFVTVMITHIFKVNLGLIIFVIVIFIV